MKNKKLFQKTIWILFSLSLFVFFQCSLQVDESEAPQYDRKDTAGAYQHVDTGDQTSLPMDISATSRWTEWTHNSVTEICAAQWGLSYGRRQNMRVASEMPDTYQSGLENGFNQQWSHAYLYNSWGWHLWGDADEDFHDNIDGTSEGYNGKWAGYYYNQNNQYMGDWYLGYACHFIEDVSLVLHSSFPSIDMLLYHFDFEEWVHNNLSSGHNFLNSVSADYYYYPITDLKAAVRSAAYHSSYGNSTVGKKVWDNYVSSGYPTGTGTGNSELVTYTKQMIRDAGRYVKGTIKYTLDKYGEWISTY